MTTVATEKIIKQKKNTNKYGTKVNLTKNNNWFSIN